MKKMYLFIVGLAFTACVSDNLEKSSLSETTISSVENSYTNKNELDKLKLVALTGDTKIPVEEAKELALYTANQMREIEGIVTKAPLRIKGIEVIKNGIKKEYIKTKAGKEEKSDLYLLNFENNQGYVLTSADRRVSGVFAYSSTGNLGDTIQNQGQNILLERVMYYMEQKKAEFDKNRLKLAVSGQEELFKNLSKEQQQDLIKDGLFDESGKRIVTKRRSPDCWTLYRNNNEYNEPPTYKYGSWKTIYKKAPLVKTLWCQTYNTFGARYNKLIKESCKGVRNPVGCVAVAVGQIIASHKKPAYFKGEYMDWDDMTHVSSGDMFSTINSCKEEGVSDIQHLLAKLGGGEYLNMNYGCDKYGGFGESTIDFSLNTFHKLGYTAATKQGYNSNKIISEVKNNRPVYVTGCAYKIIRTYEKGWWVFKETYTKTSYENCHAWVLDGYVKRIRKVRVTKLNNDFLPINELHDAYITRTYNQTLELVHNNMGSGGYSDGYSEGKFASGWYHKGLFNANIGPKESSDTYKSGTEGNFQYENEIITNIK